MGSRRLLAGRIDFRLYCDAVPLTCPACGAEDQPVHDCKAHSWRHPNTFQYQVRPIACVFFTQSDQPGGELAHGKQLQPVGMARAGVSLAMFEARATHSTLEVAEALLHGHAASVIAGDLSGRDGGGEKRRTPTIHARSGQGSRGRGCGGRHPAP